jgi:hypothetical protein
MMGIAATRWMGSGLQAASFALPLTAEVACNQVLANDIWSAWWTLATVVLAAARTGVMFLLPRTRRSSGHDNQRFSSGEHPQ